MTPKVKAKELIESFYKCMPFRDVKLTSCDETPELIIQMEKLSAKQCALIAVEEIQSVISLQKTTLSICAYRTLEDFNHDIRYNEMLRHEVILYFDFVKQEIEKL
jgi:hypothetical protein